MSSLFPAPGAAHRIRVVRAFKAFDDGRVRKWVAVVPARELPENLPLDANARIPNIARNQTCVEMRETLFQTPELFQILNGGIVCTASSIEMKQEGADHVMEVRFDTDREQGIVNGGHTYATLLNVLQDDDRFSSERSFRALLERDGRYEPEELEESALQRVRHLVREKAQVQIEFVAPVQDTDLLAQIARARNLSQSVEATALANLAGKFDLMKRVLGEAPLPFGDAFVGRVVWKTNQEVEEGSRAVPVKALIHLLSLVNIRAYPPGGKLPNEVYNRSGAVIRQFAEAEGEEEQFYARLTALLPQLIELHEHIYLALPEADPGYPWADGKLDSERKRRRGPVVTPFLGRPADTKVINAFVWPVVASLRLLLRQNENGEVAFAEDPVALFETIKNDVLGILRNSHRNHHGIAHQLGKDKEVWLRLENAVEGELRLRERMRSR